MKKLLVLLLAMLMAFSFIACDNSTKTPGENTGNNGDSSVMNPGDEIVKPTVTRGEISKDLLTKCFDMVNYVSASAQPESMSENSYALYYDTENVLTAIQSIVDNVETTEIKKDGTYLKNGDIYKDENWPSTINGIEITHEQKQEYNDLTDKFGLKDYYDYYVMAYKNISYKGSTYNFDITSYRKGTSSQTFGDHSYTTKDVAKNYSAISLNKPYEGITSFALYCDISGVLAGNYICEIKGNSNVAGVYSISQKLMSEIDIESVLASAPANNTTNDVNFGGTTDEEKFNFADKIYDDFLNVFMYHTGEYTQYKLEDETRIYIIKNFITNDGAEFFGYASLDSKSNLDINVRVVSSSGDVFDFIYDEKTVSYDEYGQDWVGFFTLNGYYIDIPQTTPR